MPNTDIEEVILWLTSTDHEPFFELHGLGSLLSEFTGDNNLATKGSVSHNSLDDGQSSQSYWYLLKEFVFQGFNLSRGTKTLLKDWFKDDLDGVCGVAESFLEERGEFVEFLSVFSGCGLGFCDIDDDFGLGWSDFNLNTGITSRLKRSLKELMEFSIENTVCDEFSFLAHSFSSTFLFHFTLKICL
jgi:hypothetical protein